MDISVEQEGKSVSIDLWPTMTLKQLYDQKTILGDRLEYAYRLQNQIIFGSLQKGLNDIEYFISIKLNEEDKSNNNKNIII